jgi:hypothetical protein
MPDGIWSITAPDEQPPNAKAEAKAPATPKAANIGRSCECCMLRKAFFWDKKSKQTQ